MFEPVGDTFCRFRQGKVATIDLSAGRILGRSMLPDGRIPGNLAVGGGTLVSRGTHEVIGFRSVSEIDQKIMAQLKTNPRDPEALALRGERRLHHGEEEEAIDDLRESYRQKPDPRVKRVLAGTMLSVFRNETRRLLDAAVELESLADEPRQRIEFLRLYARALNESGNRVGAVKQLFLMANLPEISTEPIANGPGYFHLDRAKYPIAIVDDL